MKHPEAGFVIKYFDLIDEFIRVRCCSDELLKELHRGPITNKASYRNLVVHSCVPNYQGEVLPAVRKLDRECDEDIVEELLYQICIDVNPTLEIHQVAIPGNTAQGSTAAQDSKLLPVPASDAQRQELYRRVQTLERSLHGQIIGQDQAICALTRAVKKAAVGLKRPNCIVLFDEIEKAHYKVHNLLLQLLDEGIITDSKGQTVAFNQALVLMTSNLGIEKIDSIRTRMGFSAAHKRQSLNDIDLPTVTHEALREFFRPEFINRIDEVVMFNPLDITVCERIAHNMLREVSDLLKQRGIVVTFSPSVRNLLAKQGFSEEFGARELRRLLKRRIEAPITELILDHDLGEGSKVHVRVRNGDYAFSVGTERVHRSQSA